MNPNRLTTAIALMTVSCLARGPDVLATHAQLPIGGTLQLAPIEEVQTVPCGDEKNTIPQIGGLDMCVTFSQVTPDPVSSIRSGVPPGNHDPLMVTDTPIACATGDCRVSPIVVRVVTMPLTPSVALSEGSVAPDDGVYRGGPM